MENNLWQEIREEMDKVKLVDTHEHLGKELPIFRPSKKMKMNLMRFIAYSYLYGDLVSSGMKPVALNRLAWEDVKPYLENIKTTVYYRYIIRALQDFYGLEGDQITDANLETISKRIESRNENHVEWELQVLDLMNVHRMILEISEKCLLKTDLVDDERLVQIINFEELIMGGSTAANKLIHRIAESFNDYLSALDIAFDMAVENGAIGVKSSIAYLRIISFDKVEKSEAQKIFNNGIQHATPTELKKFQDFMMHEICEKCSEYKLPYEFHTGLHAGNFNTLKNSDPLLLENLFRDYSKVNFILFHGGYPYIHEVGVLAKYFPNVYLDACWLSDISISAYKRALSEWLEIVPSNKIFAWGGDQMLIEHSYASLLLAKDLIADVLVDKVNSGYFNQNLAFSVIKKILGQNAIDLYRL